MHLEWALTHASTVYSSKCKLIATSSFVYGAYVASVFVETYYARGVLIQPASKVLFSILLLLCMATHRYTCVKACRPCPEFCIWQWVSRVAPGRPQCKWVLLCLPVYTPYLISTHLTSLRQTDCLGPFDLHSLSVSCCQVWVSCGIDCTYGCTYIHTYM